MKARPALEEVTALAAQGWRLNERQGSRLRTPLLNQRSTAVVASNPMICQSHVGQP